MNRSIVYKSFTHANGWQTIFAFRDSVVAIITLFRWRAENASFKKLPISVQYSFGRQVTYLGALKKFHRLILVHRCHLMSDSSCSTSKFPANISWNWQLAKTVCSPSSSLFSRSSGALGNQLFDEYSLTLISARPVLRLIKLWQKKPLALDGGVVGTTSRLRKAWPFKNTHSFKRS